MRARRHMTRFTLAMLLGGAFLVPLTAGPAGAGGGCHSPQTDQATKVVVIEGACFGPTITRVPVGTRVAWTNKDSFAHVVVGMGFHWGSNGELNQGDRFSTVFRAAGVYPYTCYLHPGMNGAVVVGGADAPKMASVGSDPASDAGITREATAPKAGGKVTLSAKPASQKVSAGAWPVLTAAGFGLALLLGIGLIKQRRLPGQPSSGD
jgi:plastocyanin